jgi:DNA helicase IV
VPEQQSGDDVAAAEIRAEQKFVDTVYLRLEDAAKQAQALASEGHARGKLGHEGGLVERDAMVFQAAKRMATLDAAHEGLVFGRLDLIDGDARYIGRLGLRDAIATCC